MLLTKSRYSTPTHTLQASRTTTGYTKTNDVMSFSKCNMEMVELQPLVMEEDLKYVKGLLEEFNEKTGSKIAEELLAQWPEPSNRFVKVCLQIIEFVWLLLSLALSVLLFNLISKPFFLIIVKVIKVKLLSRFIEFGKHHNSKKALIVIFIIYEQT